MVYFIKIIGLFIVLITTALSYGQRDYGRIPNLPKESLETKESDDSYRPFDFNLTVKNMHLWRGYRVTDEAMTAANVYYESKNRKFKAGLWEV